MTYGSHIHFYSLLFASIILVPTNVNCKRLIHSDLIVAEDPDAIERNYDPGEDENLGGKVYDPVLADKRSISLSNLFFPGAAEVAAKQAAKRANAAIGNSKEHSNNNLFRSSVDLDQVGSNGKSNNNDDDLNKRHNKHGAEDAKHKGPKIWDQWGKWSSCSSTCGIGKITRWRHCVSGGCAAGEKEAQIKTCTMPAC